MYRDSTLAGFGVRVSQAGAKTFVLAHGRERRFTTIGRYPILTLAQARAAARRLIAQKTLGLLQPPSISFGQAYEKFKTEHLGGKRPRTRYDYMRVLEKYFLPTLATTRLAKITYEQLTAITDPLAAPQASRRMRSRWPAPSSSGAPDRRDGTRRRP